jgi:hypothetical protein
MATDLDCLFIGNQYLQKDRQNQGLVKAFKEELEPLDD